LRQSTLAENIGGMVKRRGYPDRRGMGAQSDFISASFVPSAEYRAEQIARAKALIATGLPLEKVAAMLSLPLAELQKSLGTSHSS
jgi:hypothetical protein